MNGDPVGWHLDRRVPISIIATLLVQTLMFAWIWAQDHFRIGALEVGQITQDSVTKEIKEETSRRFTSLEAQLPRIAVIEDRQLTVLKRLDENGIKMDQLLTRVPKIKE